MQEIEHTQPAEGVSIEPVPVSILPSPVTSKNNVPESNRLTRYLVNQYQKDIRATIGSYNPKMVSWTTGGKIDFGKGAARFKDNKMSDLGKFLAHSRYIKTYSRTWNLSKY
jgi:hypothetical protein